MRTHLRILLAGLLLSAPAASLDAQRLQGRVVSTSAAVPVAWSLVQFLGADGHIVAATTTNTMGNWVLVGVPAGEYRVQVAAIGFVRGRPRPVTVTAESMRLADFILTPQTASLVDLRVRGTSVCGITEEVAPVFGQALDAAQTSLEVIEATARSGDFEFEIAQLRRVIPAAGPAGVGLTESHIENAWTAHSWPVVVTSPARLRDSGWATSGISAGPGIPVKRTYFGPDAPVLFADWFTGSHCFTMHAAKNPADTTVKITFEPKASTRVEIAGTMTLDRHSLALLSVEWEYRNLPTWIKPTDTGGRMLFAPLPDGGWYPRMWEFWAPAEHERQGRLMGPVSGRTEERSTVTKVTRVRPDSIHTVVLR